MPEGRHVAGLVYRALNPVWARQPLSGEGARRFGGRFNAKGVPALYTSLDPLTAIREASQAGRPLQPTTLVSYRADVTPVLDGNESETLAAFGLTPAELAADDWRLRMQGEGMAPTQGFAERVRAAGFAGLLVPSYARDAQAGDRNLVLWRWSGRRPARLVLNDEEGRLG